MNHGEEKISREQEDVAINESDDEEDSPEPKLQPFKAEAIAAISCLRLLFMDETDQRNLRHMHESLNYIEHVVRDKSSRRKTEIL